MKWLTIPEDIPLIDEITLEPLKDDKGEIQFGNFVEFVVKTMIDDPDYFGKSIDDLESRQRIRDALLKHRATPEDPPRRAKAGDVVGIESTDHEKGLQMLRKPSKGFNPRIASQLLPFMRAWKDATDKDPRLATA